MNTPAVPPRRDPDVEALTSKALAALHAAIRAGDLSAVELWVQWRHVGRCVTAEQAALDGMQNDVLAVLEPRFDKGGMTSMEAIRVAGPWLMPSLPPETRASLRETAIAALERNLDTGDVNAVLQWWKMAAPRHTVEAAVRNLDLTDAETVIAAMHAIADDAAREAVEDAKDD